MSLNGGFIMINTDFILALLYGITIYTVVASIILGFIEDTKQIPSPQI